MTTGDQSFVTVISVLTAYVFALLLSVGLAELDNAVIGAAMQAGAIVVSAGAAIYVGRITFQSSHVPIEDKAEKSWGIISSGILSIHEELESVVSFYKISAWDEGNQAKNLALFTGVYENISDIDISFLDLKYVEMLSYEKIRATARLRYEILSLRKVASYAYNTLKRQMDEDGVDSFHGPFMNLLQESYGVLLLRSDMAKEKYKNFIKDFNLNEE